MATFVHIEGLEGLNLELVTHWGYSEKVAPGRKGVDVQPGVPENRLTLHFAGGEVWEVTGKAADALHRHFCTVGRSLT